MNKKILIPILVVFAILIGAIIYLILIPKKPTTNTNTNTPGVVSQNPRDNYIKLLSGNLAEQLNSYSYNDLTDLNIAESQSTENYKLEIENRKKVLISNQKESTKVVTEADRSRITYTESDGILNVKVPVIITDETGTSTKHTYKLQLTSVGNDWLLSGAVLE